MLVSPSSAGLTEPVSRAGLPSLSPGRSQTAGRGQCSPAPLTAPSLETCEKPEPRVAKRSDK